jgi:hypothetical protein
MLVSYLAYSSTLKLQATYSSETSVYFHWTTGSYIPEDGTFHVINGVTHISYHVNSNIQNYPSILYFILY